MSERLYQIYLQFCAINRVFKQYGFKPVDVNRHMLRFYEAASNLV